MGRSRIKVKRFCYACGSDKTELTQGRWPHWYPNHDKDNNVLCHDCFMRHCYLPVYYARRYEFCGTRLQEDNKSRVGICSKCGIKVGDRYIGWRNHIVTVQETQLHHQFYLIICPWFSRVELCVYCHDKIRWKEWKDKQKTVQKVKEFCSLCKSTDSISRWWYHHNGEILCRRCWRNTVYGPTNRERINKLARLAEVRRKSMNSVYDKLR
jgi:hypothetical protein